MPQDNRAVNGWEEPRGGRSYALPFDSIQRLEP